MRETQTAAELFPAYAESPPDDRAAALRSVADALEAAAGDLVPAAMAETGLAEARLRGELTRTAVQLRLFAEVCTAGDYLGVRIDEPDPGFVLGPRPDLRRLRVPLGPALVFAASNFPFAFSVAGGDTAAALAAGCPVLVKAHPGHPRLAQRTAETVRAALAAAGQPADLLQLIHGQDTGVRALRDDRIAVASFTGSLAAGRVLAKVAAERDRPIPFYGELGSVNPVVVTPAALAERAGEIAAGFVASVSGSAGQLCTKPGFLFLSEGHGLAKALADAAAGVAEHPLLHPGIAAGYTQRRAAVLGAPGVELLAEGTVRSDSGGWTRVTPTLVRIDLAGLEKHRAALLDEAFGPLSIVVDYDPDRLTGAVGDLFPGSLTATVHSGADEDSDWLRDLVATLRDRAGRLIFNGWPTGVAVTPAMQHGGPYPSSTAAGTTSVGTAAIGRFLRPVTYQNCPPALLPPPLRDDNPWGVPQRRSPAGESVHWGRPNA